MGIREAILLCVSLAICVTALVRPKIGIFGYIWYSLMRPDVLAFVEVKYPLSLMFAICSLLGAFRYLPQAGAILRAPTIRFLLLLQIPVGLSIVFAIQPDLDMDRYTYYVRNLA